MFKPFLIITWKNYFSKVARELARHVLFPRKALLEVTFDTVAVARRQGSIPRKSEPWQDLGVAGFQPRTWLGPT